MTAESIMDPDPVTLKHTDTVGTAARQIMEHRFRSLPVIDEHGCYMGTFGVNRLLRLVLPPAAVMERGLRDVHFIHETLADLHERLHMVENKPVTVCMHTDTETVAPDTPLVETLLLLYRTRASIPVIEPGSCRLLGVISYWDAGRHILSA